MDKKILVEWYNEEKTVIHQTFYEGWTLEDYWASVRVAHQMIGSMAHRVYLISTVVGDLVIPEGFISALRTASNNVRENEGIHVVVGGSFLVSSLLRIGGVMNRRNQTRIRTAKTIEEALNMIYAEIQRERMTMPRKA